MTRVGSSPAIVQCSSVGGPRRILPPWQARDHPFWNSEEGERYRDGRRMMKMLHSSVDAEVPTNNVRNRRMPHSSAPNLGACVHDTRERVPAFATASMRYGARGSSHQSGIRCANDPTCWKTATTMLPGLESRAGTPTQLPPPADEVILKHLAHRG